MERGDRVRPTGSTLERTRFRSESRLRVALKGSSFPPDCRACGAALSEGELFARGSEQTSALCLSCVEPVPAEATA